MDNTLVLQRARRQRSINAQQRRNLTQFVLSFRGGGTVQITGFAALAEYLKLKESSIPVLLSKGGGNTFELLRTNPTTDEQDICTVSRLVAAKEGKPRGRPRKLDITDERLGSEAAHPVQPKRRR